MKTVCAPGLISIDDVNAGPHQRQQPGYFADVVLAVAVGVEYEILCGVIESAL